jgi:ABC-type sugar transport system substrate-binding protein
MKNPVKSTVRRHLLLAGVAAALAAQVTTALAAQTLVEIIAFAHPPVEDALRPLEPGFRSKVPK